MVTAEQSPSLKQRFAHGLSVGGGKERAEKLLSESETPATGIWAKDTQIRGYNVGGWTGMAEGVVVNGGLGGAALGADLLEQKLWNGVTTKKGKEIHGLKHPFEHFIEKRYPTREYDGLQDGEPTLIKVKSSWFNVLDNAEESLSDELIDAGAQKIVNTAIKDQYRSALAETISTVVNLGSFIFQGTERFQRWGINYGKVRNSVNATDTEAAMRVFHLVPVVGAWAEKHIYTPLNHKLENSKAVKFFNSWTARTMLWLVLGMIKNDAVVDAVEKRSAFYENIIEQMHGDQPAAG